MFQEYLSVIAQGIPTSLLLTVVSLLIAFCLALFLTFLLSMENKWGKRAVNLYLTLFTGTPLLVQFFLIYAGPGQFQWIIDSPLWYLLSNAWFCAALALALNSAAYSTQLFHGAVKAIPKGQWESAAALGLPKAHTFVQIILPQVWRHALPGLSNQWLVLLKDTALISLIGVSDLMRQTELINTNEHQPFTWYGFAALIYLAITLISQAIIRRLELRFTRFERGEA